MERLLYFLLLVAAIEADTVRKSLTGTECDKMVIKKINNYYYLKEDDIKIEGVPSDFSVHWRSRKIYYTLISNDYTKMQVQVLHKNRIRTLKLEGNVAGQSTAVDNRNNFIYIGTDNGIYRYNDISNAESYTAVGEDVMYLAVSNDGSTMYIATWPQNRVHKITNFGQHQETFPHIPNGHDLKIDTNDNLYFVASKTSYILQPDSSLPIKIKGLPVNKMTGIFVSRSDKVYGMDETGSMYLIDPVNAKASLLGSFDVHGVNAFAMDALDNVLIGVQGAILKYHKMDASPCSVYNTLLQ